MEIKAIDIAKKILAEGSNTEFGELISNLKLQKLLYYIQGFHLAYFDEPLFKEDFEAWMYGPVVPCVYEAYKSYGNKGIEYHDEVIKLKKETEALFKEVFRIYRAYSAIGLMNMTHSEAPWKYASKREGSIIEKKAMKMFYKKRLK